MTEAVQRNFNLYPEDLDTLYRVAEKFNGSGRRNLSQALRLIIDEWRRQQGDTHAETTINSSEVTQPLENRIAALERALMRLSYEVNP